MPRLVDGEVRVSARAIYVRDGMAHAAGNPRVRGWVIDVVKLGIVKRTREKRHRVATTRAEARALHCTVTLECELAGVTH